MTHSSKLLIQVLVLFWSPFGHSFESKFWDLMTQFVRGVCRSSRFRSTTLFPTCFLPSFFTSLQSLIYGRTDS
ncbi:hypothetical protein BJY52DRAFT_657147 [Lactarius psammicola]|nr:hypothetical protein BJY52DRAFT_657147 [Lactarius psammicola]